MSNTIISHRVDKVEKRVEKLEDSFKNLSTQSTKHNEKIDSINEKITNIDDKKASHHDIKNQKNVTGLIFEHYKSLENHEKKQDLLISENTLNIEKLSMKVDNTVNSVDKLINKIDNMTTPKTIGFIIGGITAVTGVIISVMIMLNKLMVL